MAKALRKSLELGETQFAALATVDLRNRKQAGRGPQRPGRALLRAMRKDPIDVLKVLAA